MRTSEPFCSADTSSPELGPALSISRARSTPAEPLQTGSCGLSSRCCVWEDSLGLPTSFLLPWEPLLLAEQRCFASPKTQPALG